MRPYKIEYKQRSGEKSHTWIDLDHVVAISYEHNDYFQVYSLSVSFIFKDESLVTDCELDENFIKDVYEPLLKAWGGV